MTISPTNLAAAVEALQQQCAAALELLREEYGWMPFGSHIDIIDVKLEFWGESKDGLPLFERVVVDGGTTHHVGTDAEGVQG